MSTELFLKVGQNHAVYLNDGSGCEKCNFTGRFGGWVAGHWHGYPQISCSHCAPIDRAEAEANLNLRHEAGERA